MRDSHADAKQNGLSHVGGNVADHVRRLARLETELAVAELASKAKRSIAGIVLVAAAGVTALFAGATAVATIVALIALALPLWAALLIMSVALLGFAGTLALVGVRLLRAATPPVPQAAVKEARRTVDELARS